MQSALALQPIAIAGFSCGEYCQLHSAPSHGTAVNHITSVLPWMCCSISGCIDCCQGFVVTILQHLRTDAACGFICKDCSGLGAQEARTTVLRSRSCVRQKRHCAPRCIFVASLLVHHHVSAWPSLQAGACPLLQLGCYGACQPLFELYPSLTSPGTKVCHHQSSLWSCPSQKSRLLWW